MKNCDRRLGRSLSGLTNCTEFVAILRIFTKWKWLFCTTTIYFPRQPKKPSSRSIMVPTGKLTVRLNEQLRSDVVGEFQCIFDKPMRLLPEEEC